ncbi:LysR family transcriptional regulator [Francisella persica ATCC VR-331]|uniref:LysR family transcriptional regulator n=1 Tax=Francisella persica ATCC VR-331 TaxID=1086726 RepID=A0AAC8VCY9_9GAMM|nr:PACE efflux transporter [Francisella persica]ALB01289.1 LysR family transcriptional regulator [Francisella persica ATCC VR-331]ANH77580.1 LysR family transcriptional regulator [Francisella persica ATCC VR-331]
MSFLARIIHTIGFEFFGIVIFTPFAMFILHQDIFHISSLAIIISLIAMLWNFIYNYIFDIIEIKFGMCRSKRKIIIRGLHTLLFELGLLVVTIPLVAYILNMNLLVALVVDIGFVIFYLIYAFMYNYTFDKIYFNFIHR